MLSKVSTFLGPNGVFSRGGLTPSLVLSLDAFGYTGSGIWPDLSKFHNDATSDGPISWNSDVGGSFDFEGTSAYFGFATVSGIPIGNSPYTMEVWFKSNSYGNGCAITVEANSPNITTWLNELNNPAGFGLYLGVGIWNGSNWLTIEKLALNGGSLTYQDVIDFYDALQDVTCTLNLDTNQLDFTWYETVSCGFTYTLKIAIVSSLNDVLSIDAEGNPINCNCTSQGSLVSWGGIGTTNYSNVLRLNDNGITNYWWGNDIYADFSGSQSLYLDNWYYVASTYDGTNRKIYLNGVEVVTSTVSTPLSVDDMTTLKIGYDGLNYFSGKISKVKVHTKALSSEKVLSNFNADKVRHGYVYGSMIFSSSSSSNLISSSDDFVFVTNDFTIEAFFYPQLSTYAYGGIVSTKVLGQIDVAINTVLSNTSTPLIEFNAAGVYLTYTASNNKWYHAAISRTGATTSFYVNGNLFTEITDNTDYTNNQIAIGKYYTNYDSYYFNGLISNVRVINGIGLYTGPSFIIPTTPLEWSSDTKLLITSQKTSPTLDVSGNLQTTSASNIGWTSSLPEFYYYNFTSFSIASQLTLYDYSSFWSGYLVLTGLASNDVGNIYTVDAIRYDKNFSLEWNFECSGGSGADGFCVQWTNSNILGGMNGGGVGAVVTSAAINVFQFQTHTNNKVIHRYLGSEISFQPNAISFRQNVYYWMDYNYSTSTMYISYATTNTKPLTPQHTFTSVTFDDFNYYLGFGAANGGSNDFHILKSFKLKFT